MRARKTIDRVVGAGVATRPDARALRSVPPHEPKPSAPAGAQLWLGVHVPLATAQSAPQLRHLAARAQRFTPHVSLAPPDGLLLEVKGSLRLFGGVAGIQRELALECVRCGVPGTLALAPTPLAALTAARAGQSLMVLEPARLVGQLSSLPLTALRWPDQSLERLAAIGVRTIGQALRLPRAGFAQRFGAAQLQDLDRLTGRACDPRARFEARTRFRGVRELPYESADHAALRAAMTPLLDELGRFLAARQCGVLAIECRLWHRAAPPTRCTLRLAAPLADAVRLKELLGERLGTLILPEPVRACELRSGLPVPRALSSEGLWQPGEQGGSPGAHGPQLIERLRARLGPDAVRGLVAVRDHRPEAAWRTTEPEACLAAQTNTVRCPGRGAARPLWLLPTPQPLVARGGLPRYRGELRLLGEPERIETGWWDGREVARDYYTALDAHGRRLWLFRERIPPHRWFLQGMYG